MTFATALGVILVAFVCGIVVGLLMKGVNININHKQQELPTDYNKQPLHAVPEEIKQYALQHKGYNDF